MTLFMPNLERDPHPKHLGQESPPRLAALMNSSSGGSKTKRKILFYHHYPALPTRFQNSLAFVGPIQVPGIFIKKSYPPPQTCDITKYYTSFFHAKTLLQKTILIRISTSIKIEVLRYFARLSFSSLQCI